jgi:phage baseplate assembly protein W
MPWIIPTAPESSPTVTADSAATGVPANFDAPFRLNADGTVATVAQGSPADIDASIYNILACPQGGKLHDPAFGIPSPLFDAFPVGTAAIVAAIQKLEPRASAVQITQTLNQLRQVDLTISAQA